MSTSRLVRDRAEDPRGDLAQRAEQEVHRPIRRVVGKPPQPAIATRSATHRVAASLLPGSSARCATSANSTRSTVSARPKLWITFAEGTPVTGWRSLCASCRYDSASDATCHGERRAGEPVAGSRISSERARPSLSSLDIERPRAAGRRLRRSTDCADDIDQRPLALRGFLQAFIVSRRHTA